MGQNQCQTKYMLIANPQGNQKFRNIYQLNILEKPWIDRIERIDIARLQKWFEQKTFKTIHHIKTEEHIADALAKTSAAIERLLLMFEKGASISMPYWTNKNKCICMQTSFTSRKADNKSQNLSVTKIFPVGFSHDVELLRKKWSQEINPFWRYC